jgi:hypothetical protein
MIAPGGLATGQLGVSRLSGHLEPVASLLQIRRFQLAGQQHTEIGHRFSVSGLRGFHPSQLCDRPAFCGVSPIANLEQLISSSCLKGKSPSLLRNGPLPAFEKIHD